MTRSLGLFTAVHLAANAAILSGAYVWLGIGETRALTLAESLFVAVLLVLAVSVTYGATFAFFGLGEREEVLPAWKSAARNLLPLASAAVVIALAYWILTLWQDYSSQPAFKIASFLTVTFRTPIAPGSVGKVLDGLLWAVRWAALPVVFVPMLASIATRGWKGFSSAARGAGLWWLWCATPVLLLGALWAPLAILAWKPHVGGFAMQMVSFTIRAVIAYLIFGAAWLALAFTASAGTPRLTQPSTVATP